MMPTQITFNYPEGMTLADLIQFTQECDHAGIDPRTQVLVRVGFRAQVKKITAGGKLG